MNENFRNIIKSFENVYRSVGDTIFNFNEIERKIKKQFGIAVPLILHNMLCELCMLSKKVTTKVMTQGEEKDIEKYVVGRINETIVRYKNLYNSAEEYSNEDIKELMDKYSMKEQMKEQIKPQQDSVKEQIKTPPVWIKMKTPNYDTSEYFGNREESRRIWLMTKDNTTIMTLTYGGSAITSMKTLATFDSSKLPMIKALVEKQYESLLRGEKLIY